MKHPLTFFFSIGKSLILNGVEIGQEIQKAVQDWDNENYNDFGRQEGKILY